MRSRPSTVPQRGLAALAAAADLEATGDPQITGVSLVSGRVRPGDLFAALAGTAGHGIDYLDQALAAGAAGVLTDPEAAKRLPADVPCVVAAKPREVLGALAAELYDHPTRKFRTFGVTGTQGKTTTTHLAEAAWGQTRAAVIGTNGTRIRGAEVDSRLTTPEAPDLQALFAVMAEEKIEMCAMEVSSHALVQGRVNGFCFDTAAFLNLGRDHLDFHADMDDYFQAKAKLFTPEHTKHAVINVGDPYGARLAAETDVPTTTFSFTGTEADWQADQPRETEHGGNVMLHGPDGATIELFVPLVGTFNLVNAAAAELALARIGGDTTTLAAGLAKAPGVSGRMELIEAGQPFRVVVDYAHKPQAISAVLAALRPSTSGRLIIVLGAGGDRDRGKRPQMGSAAAAADLVIVTDDNPRTEDPAVIRAEVIAGLPVDARAVEVADRREAIAYALKQAAAGDTVVIAGKGHETGQEIDGIVQPFDDREVARGLLGAHRD